MELGIFGLIHLAIVVYVIIKIFESGATVVAKIIWTLIVAAFPLLGVIAWYFLGPGTGR